MLKTEMRNQLSTHIDTMSTTDVLKTINNEDMNAVVAVQKVIGDIARACEAVTKALENGGRLVYIGAGTSGRLGVIDATECPPTYGVSPNKVVGIIAGGEKCMTSAAETEEDSAESGVSDLKKHNICVADIVMGISAAGGAAYVVGALKYAAECGCTTISLTSNENAPITQVSDIAIVVDTGAEVIAGSTRMKAATAQKLVLNMISTCAMIKMGKVYENMMINVKPVNKKLRERVIRIVCEILKCDSEQAVSMLEENEWDIRRTVESVK